VASAASLARRSLVLSVMVATVSASLVRSVLAGVARLGADPVALARETGLRRDGHGSRASQSGPADSGTRHPVTQLAHVWQLAALRLADPHIGLYVASQWRLGTYHLGDYLMDTAPTLADALTLAITYLPLLNNSPDNDVGFSARDSYGALRCHVRTPNHDAGPVATEFALATMLARARHAAGRPVTPVHVRFASAAPSSHRELCEAFGTRRIDFGAEVTAMDFRRADVQAPLPRADPVLAGILRQVADAEIAALDRPVRWIDVFRQVVGDCLDDQTILLADAATRLAVSPRTLQRLLEQEGTSWRAELDVARGARAAKLRAEGVGTSAVAARLGYSDTRTLRRAARRWSGS
jgi:AraC-like DNA-binding protein